MEFSRDTRLAIAAGIAILVLPPFLVPYLPFHDLVAFIGMQGYPPKLSYGPTHYYAFQLTYFLHHLISRVITDLGGGTHAQFRVYYLLHALGYFAVTVGLLNRFVRQPRLKALAILGGSLAFTDGMFAIGGPLPFSLAGVLIMLSVLLISEAREMERPPNRALLIGLALMALLSHPFAAPVLLLVYVVNFWLTPSQRLTSGAVLASVSVYALLIGRDSPESVPLPQLWQMFDPNLPHVWHNLTQALTWDSYYIHLLFNQPLPVVSAYVNCIAAVKLAGALLAIVAFQKLWRNPRLRLLLVLELAFVALYACGVDAITNYVVPQWPQRIWSIANPLLYSFAVIAAAELAPLLPIPKLPQPRPLFVYGALAAILVILAIVQIQLLNQGRILDAAFQSVKATVLKSGARDSLVTWTGSGNIYPFFLRSAPYLLFSDPDMIERKLLFVTDWHVQPRHNTHIPELNFASPRPRLNMEFLPSDGTINAVIHGLEAPAHFPLTVRFGDRIPRTGAGEPLLTTGKAGDANILFALAPSPGTVVFYLDAWGSPWTSSVPVAIDPQREYAIDLWLNSNHIKLDLDGKNVWERDTPVRSLDNPIYGRNPVGGTMAVATFSGTVTAR